jgi:hypothetical protein
LQNTPAQLDLAADRTCIPEAFAHTLRLPQVGVIEIGGVGDTIQEMPAFAVEIAVHDFPAKLVKVVASPGEEWILLGRDVLNSHTLHLNGPGLVFDIG